jgi:Flp pilus assembly protein TadD
MPSWRRRGGRSGPQRAAWAGLATLLALTAAHPAGARTTGLPAHHALAPDVAPAPSIDPLALNDEMRRWVRQEVPAAIPEDERLARLLAVIQTELELRYDAWATLTASEVFLERRYNCLAFAHLVVALGRELGLDAHYLQASGIQQYEREGDLVLLSGHVTAAAGEATGVRRVVDLGIGQWDYHNGTRISDAHALALHYANLGAAELRAGRVESALPPLLAAVRAAPEVGAPWVDLGVALRRRGDFAGAEAAYQRAIEAEPRAVAAYDNLYLLLLSRGRREAAEGLLRSVPREGKRNPWLLLSLGDSCLAAGDLEGARRFYKLARAAAPREAAPLAALAAWHLRRGDEPAARRWWRRALAADPEEPRLVPLRARFAVLGPSAASRVDGARAEVP